jgi:hypothetical protein
LRVLGSLFRFVECYEFSHTDCSSNFEGSHLDWSLLWGVDGFSAFAAVALADLCELFRWECWETEGLWDGSSCFGSLTDSTGQVAKFAKDAWALWELKGRNPARWDG